MVDFNLNWCIKGYLNSVICYITRKLPLLLLYADSKTYKSFKQVLQSNFHAIEIKVFGLKNFIPFGKTVSKEEIFGDLVLYREIFE